MIMYGIPTCDTCRKALKALKEAGHNATLRDIRKDPLPKEDYVRFYDEFGNKLINRASATWRKLSDTEREGSPIELLEANPTLMKRPVIETAGELYMGWTDETRDVLLK